MFVVYLRLGREDGVNGRANLASISSSRSESRRGNTRVQDKSAAQLLTDLIALVKSFNLQREIENSLDAKLQNAQLALSAAKANDKVGACQMMTAFNSEVQAHGQRQLRMVSESIDQ